MVSVCSEAAKFLCLACSRPEAQDIKIESSSELIYVKLNRSEIDLSLGNIIESPLRFSKLNCLLVANSLSKQSTI